MFISQLPRPQHHHKAHGHQDHHSKWLENGSNSVQNARTRHNDEDLVGQRLAAPSNSSSQYLQHGKDQDQIGKSATPSNSSSQNPRQQQHRSDKFEDLFGKWSFSGQLPMQQHINEQDHLGKLETSKSPQKPRQDSKDQEPLGKWLATPLNSSQKPLRQNHVGINSPQNRRTAQRPLHQNGRVDTV